MLVTIVVTIFQTKLSFLLQKTLDIFCPAPYGTMDDPKIAEDINKNDSFQHMYQSHVDYCSRNGTLGCTVKEAQICQENYVLLESVLVRISSKEMPIGFEMNEGIKFLSFPSTDNLASSSTTKKIMTHQAETSFFPLFGLSTNVKEKGNRVTETDQEKIIQKNAAEWLARHWTKQSTVQCPNHSDDGSIGNVGWSSWMYSKSSDLIVSLLAKLDLADEPNDLSNQKNDDQIFQDDCFDTNNYGNNVDYAEDDCLTNKSVPKDAVLGTSNDLFIYNIDLLLSCCRLLTTNVLSEISFSYEYEERGQVIDMKSENGSETCLGLLLHRYRHSSELNASPGSCLSLAQYAQCVGEKYKDDHSGKILMKLPQLHQNQLDLLAHVLVAANYATWAGHDDSMIVIFQNQQKDGTSIGVKLRESYHVALLQLNITKSSLESRVENALIPKADDLKSRAIHEKKDKKNIPRAMLYLKRFKVIESEIDRSMKIICNLEQQAASLSTARNNIQIMESYTTTKDAMSTMQLNQDEVENVMREVQEISEEANSTHDVLTNRADSTIDDRELEDELYAIMQEEICDNLKNTNLTDTSSQQTTSNRSIDGEHISRSTKETSSKNESISSNTEEKPLVDETMNEKRAILS